MQFEQLVFTIQQTHHTLQESAVKAINKHLTIRNWLIGLYIIEFEQNGEDRAKYGEKLLQKLAERLSIDALSYRNLRLFRLFYQTYPQIGKAVAIFLDTHQDAILSIAPLRLNESQSIQNQIFTIWQSAIAKFNSMPDNPLQVPPHKLISKLSYTHLVQLLPIDSAIKRTFYEIETIKGNWAVSELKRQIHSLYFERSGMSNNPEALSQIVQTNAEPTSVSDIIKSPFTFEFLGLKAKDVVYESDLEQALIEHLEAFILELGHGFCFEARQQRILIGDEYYFIDLVFYHRILKCHVLFELKTEPFNHEHIGQLKTYVNYYKKEVQRPDDNPPVGILLVTHKNEALVEYAISDADYALFVSKYLVELPTKEQLNAFILKELKRL
jgi:predicted nuclease of restriction endonuclease-like (RecB) superfamily